MKKIILLFLVLTLAACTSGTGTELSRNHQKWQDASITHYRFELTVGCFCPFGDQNPFTVEVQNGEIISIVDVNGQAVSTSDPMSEFILKYATVDRLFSELGSDSVQEADKLTVMYDTTYGFPADVTIDYIERAVDDELYLSVRAMEPLP